MPTAVTAAPASFWPMLMLALSALLLCGAAQAQNTLYYRCNTVMVYGPSHCLGNTAPVTDESDIDIDLDKKTWSFGDAGGGVQVNGSSITLLQWGARKGRDATIDRSSGAFSYQFMNGCLVENQTGTCQPRPK